MNLTIMFILSIYSRQYKHCPYNFINRLKLTSLTRNSYLVLIYLGAKDNFGKDFGNIKTFLTTSKYFAIWTKFKKFVNI